MTELKTKATDASVDDYLASRGSDEQRADCQALMALLARVTKEPPVMWGPSIVGYGVYQYTYASGRSGEMCRTGFAIRGRELVLYLLTDGDAQQSLLGRLGKHTMSKACLYFKRLADIDEAALEQLIVGSLAQLKARYG